MIFWLNNLDFAILSFVTANFMLAEVTRMGEQLEGIGGMAGRRLSVFCGTVDSLSTVGTQ